MICRFCQQWNPPGPAGARCCFCGNEAGRNEDVTVSARPAYETNVTLAPVAGLAPLAHAGRRSPAEQVLTAGRWLSRLLRRRAALAVCMALFALAFLVARC